MGVPRVNESNNIEMQAINGETGLSKSSSVGSDGKSRFNIPVFLRVLKDKISPPQDTQSQINRLHIKMNSLNKQEANLAAKKEHLYNNWSRALVNESSPNSGYITRRVGLAKHYEQEINKSQEKKEQLDRKKEKLHHKIEELTPLVRPPAVED